MSGKRRSKRIVSNPTAVLPESKSGNGDNGTKGVKRKRPAAASASAAADIDEVQRGRLERALEQRIYLIDREISNAADMHFVVLGAVGKVYYVDINATPRCSCIDYRMRGGQCKHLYFVLCRVLKLPLSHPYFSRQEKRPGMSGEELLQIHELGKLKKALSCAFLDL